MRVIVSVWLVSMRLNINTDIQIRDEQSYIPYQFHQLKYVKLACRFYEQAGIQWNNPPNTSYASLIRIDYQTLSIDLCLP